MKFVECTITRNRIVTKKWREPLFIHNIKWWYRMNIKGYKKYLNKNLKTSDSLTYEVKKNE